MLHKDYDHRCSIEKKMWPWISRGSALRRTRSLTLSHLKLIIIRLFHCNICTRYIMWRVVAGSSTSTVALRFVGSDENWSLESETIKYGHESHGTRTQKWLHLWGPAAIVNDRPVLSSDRAAQIIKHENRLDVVRSFTKTQMGALFQVRFADWPSVVICDSDRATYLWVEAVVMSGSHWR
jgi:hypothetical protein